MPSPKATLGLSAGAGVFPWEDTSTMTVDEIREKPAFGAGEEEAEGLPDAPFDVKWSEGAGTVMKPESPVC